MPGRHEQRQQRRQLHRTWVRGHAAGDMDADTSYADGNAAHPTCTGGAVNVRWTAGNGHCFQRFDVELTFADARSDCESRGGYLVTLTSAEENDFVWVSVSGQGNMGYPLIGLTDEITKGTWLWVTGEPTVYTNWNDNDPQQTIGEDAVVIVPGAGRWNDTYVINQWPYICETP